MYGTKYETRLDQQEIWVQDRYLSASPGWPWPVDQESPSTESQTEDSPGAGRIGGVLSFTLVSKLR